MGPKSAIQRCIAVRTWLPDWSRYDAVLAAIPIALLCGAALGYTLPVSLDAGVAVGGVLAVMTMADALFRNPPPASKRSP